MHSGDWAAMRAEHAALALSREGVAYVGFCPVGLRAFRDGTALAAAGVLDTPDVLLADAGYWHGEQMKRIVDRGIQVLIPPRHQPPPDAPAKLGRRPLRLHASGPGDRARRWPLPPATTDDRAGVR